jgi:WD40 repeat protein
MRSATPLVLLPALMIAVLGPAGTQLPGQASPPAAARTVQPQLAKDLHGDPLPPGALARLGTERFRPGRRIWALALSGDDKLLVSAHGDANLELWNAATGKHEGRLTAPDRTHLTLLACSPDGQFLAAAGQADVIWLWDLTTRKEPRPLEGQFSKRSDLVFSPDGKTLAWVTDFAVRLWDVATGKLLHKLLGHTGELTGVAFLPDGKELVSVGADKTLRVWDVTTGKELRQAKFKNGEPLAVWPGLGGKTVLVRTWAGSYPWVDIWDVAEVKLLRAVTQADGNKVSARTVSPDGRHLVVASGDGLQILETETGKPLGRFGAYPVQYSAVAFSSNGNRVAAAVDGFTASNYLATGRIYVWDVASGKEATVPVGHHSGLKFVRFQPDGKTIFTLSVDNQARQWDAATGKPMGHFDVTNGTDRFYCCDLSPDGRTLAVPGFWKGSGVELWDVMKGQRVATWPGGDAYSVVNLKFSPDGKFLAVANHSPRAEGRNLHVLDADTGKRLHTVQDIDPKNFPLFTPDSKFLVVSGHDELQVWDLTTWQKIHVRPSGHQALFIMLGPEKGAGSSFTVGVTAGELKYPIFWKTGIVLWNAKTGKETSCLPDGPITYFLALAPGGDRVVLRHRDYDDDAVLSLRDLASGWLLARLTGHRGKANAVAFSPDGKLLATAGTDCTTLVWDVQALIKLERKRPKEAGDLNLETLWTDLGASRLTTPLLKTLDRLAEDPAATLDVLSKHLKPVSDADLDRYVADLGSDVFAKRDKAMKELGRMEFAVAEPLERILAGKPNLELRLRAEKLLKALEEPSIQPHFWASWRSVAVLEQLDTPQARQVLATLAKGAPQARLTQLARAALERLAQSAQDQP